MAVLALGVAGCSDAGDRGDGQAAATQAPSSVPAVPPGPPVCDPPSPVRASSFSSGLPEVQGTGRGAQLWGMVMMRHPYPPFPVGDTAEEEVKIVWRMTGKGPLRMALTGPDGKARRLAWGPESHSGSTYERPGDEWGTGFRFTEPGCWHLRATRDDVAADVWLKAG
ncbi:hypothetical protein SAMN04489712_109113 [Thermomonospora echinospora]|uniref:Uncharacterized protein n=1 Tax=Thermomonospora echinospora TaxID=1992 RepID=A0A1H6CA43_9ACTN|nr:hypothetical protein SAMN04489712_109113 [Thermomonospora echinospora]